MKDLDAQMHTKKPSSARIHELFTNVCTQRTHEILVGPIPLCAIYLSHSSFLLTTALYAAFRSPVPLPAMAKRSVGFPLQDRSYGMKPRYFGTNRISLDPWRGLQVIHRLFACKSQRNCLKGSTPACCFAARKGIAECATVSQGLHNYHCVLW